MRLGAGCEGTSALVKIAKLGLIGKPVACDLGVAGDLSAQGVKRFKLALGSQLVQEMDTDVSAVALCVQLKR